MTVTSAAFYIYQRNYKKKRLIKKRDRKHRTFYTPFTRGGEQVYISFIPTNILKIRTFHELKSLPQNGFMNDLHKNEFCSCFINEAQWEHCHNDVFLRVWRFSCKAKGLGLILVKVLMETLAITTTNGSGFVPGLGQCYIFSKWIGQPIGP